MRKREKSGTCKTGPVDSLCSLQREKWVGNRNENPTIEGLPTR